MPRGRLPAGKGGVRIEGGQHHVGHLPQQLAAALHGVVTARDLGGFQKVRSKIFVGAVIRPMWRGKKFRKRLA